MLKVDEFMTTANHYFVFRKSRSSFDEVVSITVSRALGSVKSTRVNRIAIDRSSTYGSRWLGMNQVKNTAGTEAPIAAYVTYLMTSEN